MMKQQLVIFMEGEFDSDKVATFRERLGMTKRGRLSDDWDANFGHRDLRSSEQGRVWLNLYRHTDSSWSADLSYEVDPLPSDEMEQLRTKILEAAGEVGTTVTRQVPPPPEAQGQPGVPAERLAAGQERLAAWRTENSSLPGRTVTPADIEKYTVKPFEEWLVFSPPGRANRAYLVSGDTVYSFAPSQESLETAVQNARALASRES